MIKYGKIDTDKITVCMSEEIGNSLGKEWVKITEEKPDDGKFYIIDKLGRWVPSMSNKSISDKRRDVILKEWPMYKQIEALMDFATGDTKLVEEFKVFKDNIRETMPYTDDVPESNTNVKTIKRK